jgi:hypothetical protein
MKLNDFFVDQPTAQKRFDQCKTCENYNKLLKICNFCKCFMPMKVKFAKEECPIKKWVAE